MISNKKLKELMSLVTLRSTKITAFLTCFMVNLLWKRISHTRYEAHAPSNSTLSLKTFKDERGQCVSMFL